MSPSRGTCLTDRTDQRPSNLPDKVQVFAGIEMRMFGRRPRILSQGKCTMRKRRLKFDFSI